MLPSMFGESLFDDFFDDDFMRFPVWGGRNPLYGKHAKNLMKTDVRETENTYEVDIDLPGFKKDEIDVDLKDGYLTISASKGLDKDQKDKEGKYIRQERYAGAMSRSFYVGDIQPEQISAKYEDGILKISLPKQEKKELPKSTTEPPAAREFFCLHGASRRVGGENDRLSPKCGRRRERRVY